MENGSAGFLRLNGYPLGERIRDKIQATRRRGMWTGGRPVLGYDVVDKKLVVNEDEAAQVRDVFALYLQGGSLREAVAELRRRSWCNKTFQTQRGEQVEGKPFTKATLQALLTNPVYRGQIRCGDDLVQGVHDPIVDAELWDAVQEQLRTNTQNGGAHTRNKTGAVLRGLVRCGRCGSAMLHTFTTRRNRRYRFYICARAHNEGVATCPKSRVAAGKFENFVADQIRVMGTDGPLIAKTAAAVDRLVTERQDQLADEQRRIDRQLRSLPADDVQRERIEQRRREIAEEAIAVGDGTVDPDALRAALGAFQPVWDVLFPAEQERILRLLIERITYHPDGGDVEIELRPCGIDALAAEARETA